MKKQKNDGKSLEKAVHLIQAAILETQPGLKEGEFTIEGNKWVTVQGTRHNLDVYVVTRPGTPYEASFVFECKDWKEPVSKNEIIVLKEKVEAVSATRGILVARQISKGAEAFIATHPRLQFHRCSEDISPLLNSQIVQRIYDPFEHIVGVKPRLATMVLPENLLDSVCHSYNRIMLFRSFATERLEVLVREEKKAHPNRPEGTHWFKGLERLEFEPGEFIVGGVELAALEIVATYFVQVIVTPPKYRCSIDGQGQVHMFELRDKDFPSGRLDIQIVLTGPRSPA